VPPISSLLHQPSGLVDAVFSVSWEVVAVGLDVRREGNHDLLGRDDDVAALAVSDTISECFLSEVGVSDVSSPSDGDMMSLNLLAGRGCGDDWRRLLTLSESALSRPVPAYFSKALNT